MIILMEQKKNEAKQILIAVVSRMIINKLRRHGTKVKKKNRKIMCFTLERIERMATMQYNV